MKVRIRFSKTGALVYISHLDIMRYFQKLFRRSDIPVRYSEGFSPHQILSFSNPLPLGMESEGEYADVELTGSVSTVEALKRLRAESVSQIAVMSFKRLDDHAENAMAAVRYARYTVSAPISADDIKSGIEKMLAEENVSVLKKTKKNETMINIRPLIYELFWDQGSGIINMLISSGSTDNIKPELVMSALGRFAGREFDKKDLIIKRIDQYTAIDGRIISLDEVGEDIV